MPEGEGSLDRVGRFYKLLGELYELIGAGVVTEWEVIDILKLSAPERKRMTTGKLGRKAVLTDSRTLKLKHYLARPGLPLPPPPAEVSWVTKVPDWPLFMNDELGDCVIAAMAHMTEQWSFYAKGQEAPISDAQVLHAYEDVGGYVPGDPNTDNGVIILNAMNYWRKIGLAGHKIAAFVAVDFTNLREIFQAVELFGSVMVGMGLPISAQGQTAWTVADGGPLGTPEAAPSSWGGHCVPIVAGSPKTLTCITWGERLKMSHNFFADYCDEAYVVLSEEWINRQSASPGGFNLAGLQADLTRFSR